MRSVADTNDPAVNQVLQCSSKSKDSSNISVIQPNLDQTGFQMICVNSFELDLARRYYVLLVFYTNWFFPKLMRKISFHFNFL